MHHARINSRNALRSETEGRGEGGRAYTVFSPPLRAETPGKDGETWGNNEGNDSWHRSCSGREGGREGKRRRMRDACVHVGALNKSTTAHRKEWDEGGSTR